MITEASDHMPPTAQQDLAQSAAEGAAVSRQRASDILAERLPGLNDPRRAGRTRAGRAEGAAAIRHSHYRAAPLHPPPTLHADHFSPDVDAAGHSADAGAGSGRSEICGDGARARRRSALPDGAPAANKPATDAKAKTAKHRWYRPAAGTAAVPGRLRSASPTSSEVDRLVQTGSATPRPEAAPGTKPKHAAKRRSSRSPNGKVRHLASEPEVCGLSAEPPATPASWAAPMRREIQSC